MPLAGRKIFTEETEEELLNMSRNEVTEILTEKQILFCEFYVKDYNVKLAAIKAGYKPSSAHVMGWKVRQNPDVNRYIAWLKLRVSKKLYIDAVDIIDHYARIAFSDITDVVTFADNRIRLKSSDLIDGQIVKSVKEGRDGISVEMYDKLSALDKLDRYFDVMPKDWKQKIEEKKIEILQQRVEIERMKAGQVVQQEESDDGFINALKSAADEVWEDSCEDNFGDEVPK